MTTLTSRLSPLREAWQSRDPRERRTLALGGVAIVLMAGYLAVTRLDLGGADAALPARAPAALSRLPDLPAIQPPREARWRDAARRHGLTLTTLEERPASLRLLGLAERPEAVTAFARWAARRGWWATDWSLARAPDDRLRLAMTLVAEPERHPDTEEQDAEARP